MKDTKRSCNVNVWVIGIFQCQYEVTGEKGSQTPGIEKPGWLSECPYVKVFPSLEAFRGPKAQGFFSGVKL